MSGHDHQLVNAIDAIAAKACVEIVGGRGSGRSTFIKRLTERLEHVGHTVLFVRGVASFKGNPLTALVIAGVPAPKDARPAAAYAATVEAIGVDAARGNLVIAIDDWDDLDEGSWGVIEAVRRIWSVPVVLTRAGRRARNTPSGLEGSTLDNVVVLQLPAVGFDELELIIEQQLGGKADDSMLSRVFAKSGGNLAFALALVDAAVRDRRIVFDRGTWRALGDLWSPTLSAVVEIHLEMLDPEEREALETLALATTLDVEIAVNLIGWALLEQLEEQGFVVLYPAASRYLVAVVPPVLVEYFRHELPTAKRLRLTARIEEMLVDQPRGLQGPREVDGLSEPDAVFVRLSHEELRTKQLVAATAWNRTKTLATASDYLRALFYAGASSEVVRPILGQASELPGNAAERAGFAVLSAGWEAYVEGDLVAARRILATAKETDTELAPFITAVEAVMKARVSGSAEVDLAEIVNGDPSPVFVEGWVWGSRAYLHIARCEFAAARVEVERLDALEDFSGADYRFDTVQVLLLAGEGRMAEASELALTVYRAAHDRLDETALRAAGYAATLCLSAQGRFVEMVPILDTVFALGDPPPGLVPEVQAMLYFAALAATARGHASTVFQLATSALAPGESSAFPVAGPFPGMIPGGVAALEIAAAGDSRAAASALMAIATDADELGQRTTALAAAMNAFDLEADVAGEAILLAQGTEGATAENHIRALTAARDRDAAAGVAAGEIYWQQGQFVRAIQAFKRAEAWAAAEGDAAAAAEIGARRKELREALPRHLFDDKLFSLSRVILSDREFEIAKLAAQGLSNQQIADDLVISIRTAESHLHRAMKKLEVSNRRDLGDPLASYAEDLARAEQRTVAAPSRT